MGRRMEFDVASDQAGFPIVSAGTVEFDVKSVDSFFYARPEDDGSETEIYGVRARLEVTSHSDNPDQVGLVVPISFFLHNPKSRPMNKQFYLAAYGFTTKEERAFNEQYGDPELWAVEFPEEEGEEGFLGQGYTDLVGRKVMANVTIGQNKKTQMDQNQFRWMPFE